MVNLQTCLKVKIKIMLEMEEDEVNFYGIVLFQMLLTLFSLRKDLVKKEMSKVRKEQKD